MSEIPNADAEERRIADALWRKGIDDSIVTLQKGQISLAVGHQKIQDSLDKNNDMTETVLSIIENAKAFFSFCRKASKVIIWTAKQGTILTLAITALYHALDAIASHDLGALLKTWWTKK